jgi:hypothetical protein
MRERPYHRRPAHALAAGLLLALPSLLVVGEAAGFPTHPGKWTTTKMDWHSTAVNMVLLPGQPSTYHSRVLWWNHDDLSSIAGGLWGWSAPSPDTDITVNQGVFPVASFVDLHLEDPPLHASQPNNIFCAGQTMLADSSKLLITGGTALGEGGTRSTLIFNSSYDANGAWVAVDSMQFRRWYSDNTLLPTGKVVTVTGSSFSHFAVVGGIAEPADTATRMLQRYDVSYDDVWEQPNVVPSQVPDAPNPLQPFYDTGAAEIGSSSMFTFGGRSASGQLRLNAIRIQRDRNAFAPDYRFQWTDLAQSGSLLPTERAGSAVVSVKNSGDVLVIGGKSSVGPESEVWRGKIENNGITWTKLVNQGPNALPALHGLSAVYAEGEDRVFIFGGSTTGSDTPTNQDVYSLQLGASGTNELHVTLASATGEVPGPRSYGSLNYFKNSLHHVGGDPGHHRAMLFGGITVNGTYSDTLSSMWIHGPTSVVWERVTPDPGPAPAGRARHAAAIDYGSQWLIVSGGEKTSGTSTNELWAFDLTCGASHNCATDASNHWEQLENLPLPVRGHCGFVIGPEPAFPRLPEVFDPTKPSGQLQQWATLNTPHWQEWFSFGFAAPRGPAGDEVRVFYAGPEDPSSMLHLSGTPYWTYVGSNIGDWRPGSAVMYRPGKVMKCGTRDTGGNTPESVLGRTAVIDLKAPSPAWTVAATADSMIHRRNHNLVILPNGEVLVVGGARWGGNDDSNDDNCVKRPQIWYPDTLAAGHWYGEEPNGIPLDPSTVRRHYHTSAILLPDARVLVAGGNEAVETTQQTLADIYSPYYLFNPNGTTATRPVIASAPIRVSYGERFSVCIHGTDNVLSKISLIRPGATTHGFDQNQRFVPLSFDQPWSTLPNGDKRFVVNAPADSFDAPPGDYLLFALNEAGTPAIAPWIQLRATDLDTDPPAAVTTLHKLCGHDGWADLEWTPPYEDITSSACPGGPTAGSEVRWSLSTIPDDNAYNAIPSAQRSVGPPGADPYLGYAQSTSVLGLTTGTRYYFRMKTKDYAYATGNWSAMSNELTFVLHDETCGGSGGGGGCCHEEGLAADLGGNAFMQVGTGGTSTTDPTFLENTLLANTPLNTSSTDLLRLPHGPKWTSTGSRIRLSQSGALSTRYTGVRLLGVTPTAGEELFVAGHDVVSGTLIDPIRVSQAGGRDLTARFAADSAFDGRDGDTLVVEFSVRSPGRIALETSRSQLVIPPDRTGIDIQCETAQGWSSVAHHDPRELVSQALYDVASPARVRLVFLGEHRLHRVGRFVPGTAPTVMALEPTSIDHSRSGDVSTALGTGGVLLASGEHALADFAATLDQAAGLEWFLQVTGEHVPASAAGTTASLRDAESETAPLKYALEQNRPNPFENETHVGFELPVRSVVKLEVFDLMGRRVATLANATYEPGRHSVSWDRHGNRGTRVPAGVYTCRFTAGQHQEQRQMIVFP